MAKAKSVTIVRKSYNAADIIIYIVLTLLALIMAFPFYNMIIVSLAPYKDVANGQLYLYPKDWDLQNYKIIFSDQTLFSAFRVSTHNAVFGTLLGMIVTTCAGYAFSKKTLPGRGWLLTLFVITMYFGGGLVPWFLLIKDLNLMDNIFVMTIPICLSVYNMILMKNYFGTIPESLPESARIDGANELRIMLQIVIPVSMPIMATIGLFYAVGFWNEWWCGMMFIQQRLGLIPLQLLLRRIVIEATTTVGNSMANSFRAANKAIYSTGLQMATITVATVPILCVYPFVQKYFARGIMLGAIKS